MRGVHVGDLALHQLERADRLAELLALVHVGQHHVHAGLHDADRPRRQHRALVVEAATSSTLTPRPTSLSTFSSGTSQSSNTSSQVSEPRMPSLSSFCAVENPFMPFSMMKAVMPRGPALRSVLA